MKQAELSPLRRFKLALLSVACLAVVVLAASCQARPMPNGLANLAVGTGATGQPAAAMPSPRNERWCHEMHEQLKAQAASAQIGLVFLGDSITQNMDAVHDLMNKHWGQYKPANFGVGGDTTANLLWRLQDGELKGLKPKAVVLLIGTNNLSRDNDHDIVAGVRANVDELRRQLPETKVLILAILPRGDEQASALRTRVRDINSMLSKMADDKHVFYTDVGGKLLSADGTVSKAVMPDYLHPGRHGYELMFDGLDPVLKPLL